MKYLKNIPSAYLDTSIISYLVDRRKEIKIFSDITRSWWTEQRKHFSTYISPEVLAELEKGVYPYKSMAIEYALGIEQLQRKKEIIQIASIYMKQHLMPKGIIGDAMHLAYASWFKIDFLLTWNCKHLANANKKNHIRLINTKLGIFVPEIITPMELFID